MKQNKSNQKFILLMIFLICLSSTKTRTEGLAKCAAIGTIAVITIAGTGISALITLAGAKTTTDGLKDLCNTNCGDQAIFREIRRNEGAKAAIVGTILTIYAATTTVVYGFTSYYLIQILKK